jgi:hypothetical protein
MYIQENLAMWYCIFGVLVVILNGAVRKIETDYLLTLVWFLCWWMTPIALISRWVVELYNSLENYQPIRRLTIYIKRNF